MTLKVAVRKQGWKDTAMMTLQMPFAEMFPSRLSLTGEVTQRRTLDLCFLEAVRLCDVGYRTQSWKRIPSLLQILGVGIVVLFRGAGFALMGREPQVGIFHRKDRETLAHSWRVSIPEPASRVYREVGHDKQSLLGCGLCNVCQANTCDGHDTLLFEGSEPNAYGEGDLNLSNSYQLLVLRGGFRALPRPSIMVVARVKSQAALIRFQDPGNCFQLGYLYIHMPLSQ